MNWKTCLYINDSDAIVTASCNCEADIVKHLISIGVSQNTKNECGETDLHVASQEGWTHICEFLLNNGASVEAMDNDGNTSLDLANFYEHKEISELLLANGAKPRDGKSPRQILEEQIYDSFSTIDAPINYDN